MTRSWAWTCLLLTGVWAGSLILWHRLDTRPPAWDESVHLHLALDYKDFLLHKTPLRSPWVDEYPPLYHLSLIPFLSLGTPSASQTALAHAFYLLLFIAGWLLWVQAAGLPSNRSLVATLLYLGYAQVLWTARRPLMEFALSAWVVFCMALLWRTERFGNRRRTLVWGAGAGLGLLLKPIFGLCFVVPCLYLLWPSNEAPLSVRGKNFLLGALLAMIVALPWYGWEGAYFLRHAIYLAGERGVVEGDPSFMTAAGWLYYGQAFRAQMGPWSFLVTFLGITLLILRRGRAAPGAIGFLIAWALSGYLSMTLIRNKDLRYTMAILPPLAMLSTVGWCSISSKHLARWMFGGIVLGLLAWNLLRLDPPQREDWKHLAIGQMLEKNRDPGQPLLLASVLSNQPYFFPRGLRWSMRAQGWPMIPSSPGDPTADFTEFIIQKSADIGPESEDLSREWKALKHSGRAFSALYSSIGRFPLPDGSEAVVYKRDPAHAFQVGPLTKGDLQKRLLHIVHNDIQGPQELRLDGDAGQWRRGRFPHIHLEGRSCVIRGLPVTRYELEANDLWLNLYRVWDEQKLGLLAFSSLEPRLEIQAGDVEVVLQQRAKGLKEVHVHFDKGHILLGGRWRSLRLSLRGHVEVLPGRDLVAVTDSVSVGAIALPGWFFGKLSRYAVPLYPIPSFPGRILIHQVRLDQDRMEVNK